MRAIIRCLVPLCALAMSFLVWSGAAHASPYQRGSRYLTGHRMLAIINADRHAAGLSALSFDNRDAQVAIQHSRDMATNHYFSHTSPEGLSPFDRLHRAGITYAVAGENLGTDTGTNKVAMLQAIEVAMLHSPEHRANLLRATFTHVGIGVTFHGGVIFVTEDFTG